MAVPVVLSEKTSLRKAAKVLRTWYIRTRNRWKLREGRRQGGMYWLITHSFTYDYFQQQKPAGFSRRRRTMRKKHVPERDRVERRNIECRAGLLVRVVCRVNCFLLSTRSTTQGALRHAGKHAPNSCADQYRPVRPRLAARSQQYVMDGSRDLRFRFLW